jgi:hypothetical protein
MLLFDDHERQFMAALERVFHNQQPVWERNNVCIVMEYGNNSDEGKYFVGNCGVWES